MRQITWPETHLVVAVQIVIIGTNESAGAMQIEGNDQTIEKVVRQGTEVTTEREATDGKQQDDLTAEIVETEIGPIIEGPQRATLCAAFAKVKKSLRGVATTVTSTDSSTKSPTVMPSPMRKIMAVPSSQGTKGAPGPDRVNTQKLHTRLLVQMLCFLNKV